MSPTIRETSPSTFREGLFQCSVSVSAGDVVTTVNGLGGSDEIARVNAYREMTQKLAERVAEDSRRKTSRKIPAPSKLKQHAIA
jgi:Uri superfamily endonuclease